MLVKVGPVRFDRHLKGWIMVQWNVHFVISAKFLASAARKRVKWQLPVQPRTWLCFWNCSVLEFYRHFKGLVSISLPNHTTLSCISRGFKMDQMDPERAHEGEITSLMLNDALCTWVCRPNHRWFRYWLVTKPLLIYCQPGLLLNKL